MSRSVLRRTEIDETGSLHAQAPTAIRAISRSSQIVVNIRGEKGSCGDQRLRKNPALTRTYLLLAVARQSVINGQPDWAELGPDLSSSKPSYGRI
jgi:hypothetical protein